jgi:hypothetical protein
MNTLLGTSPELTMPDLVIHEFDQWSNSMDPMGYICTQTLCVHDGASDPVE